MTRPHNTSIPCARPGVLRAGAAAPTSRPITRNRPHRCLPAGPAGRRQALGGSAGKAAGEIDADQLGWREFFLDPACSR
jgi:hypothetical protein